MVDMNGRERMEMNGIGNESGVNIVFKWRIEDSEIENEKMIGKLKRVKMEKVYLKMERKLLMDKSVDIKKMKLREMIDIVDKLIEIVEKGNGIEM